MAVSSNAFSFLSKSKVMPLLQKVVAELLGTFIMMFVGGGTAYVGKRIEITLVGVAFAWTAIIIAMAYTFGHVSGCHMNPAVTIGLASARQFPWKQVPFYISAQVTGSTAACFTLSWLFNGGQSASILLTLPGEPNPVSDLRAFAWEIIISSILMVVIRSVGTDPRACGQFGGVAVGAVIFGNIIVAGRITGASMNPARSLGPAIIANDFRKIWIYLIAPVIGMITGSTVYSFFNIQTFDVAETNGGVAVTDDSAALGYSKEFV